MAEKGRTGQRITTPTHVGELLGEVRLFAELSDRERRVLAAALVGRMLQPGEVLCREGDRGASFFIVARGTIAVLKELPGGRREPLADLGASNLIGQVALIDGKPRSATCEAKTAAVVLECDRDAFERLFKAGNPFAFKVLDRIVVDLAKRLRDADEQLKSIYDNPKQTLLALHAAALGVQKALGGG